MAREEMEAGTRKSVSNGKELPWRLIFAWVLMAVVTMFVVGSITYDMGQASQNDELARVEERLVSSEEARDRLRSARDASDIKATNCVRALDATRYELGRKASVLYDVYAANSEEDVDNARVRVDTWYSERQAVQANLNEALDKCVN